MSDGWFLVVSVAVVAVFVAVVAVDRHRLAHRSGTDWWKRPPS